MLFVLRCADEIDVFSLQLARELTISPANSRLGLYPMKWRETMDAPKLPGEVELIPNEVHLLSRPSITILLSLLLSFH